MRTTRIILIGSGVALALLAGCAVVPDSDNDATELVALERFMTQDLDFGTCDASVAGPTDGPLVPPSTPECAMLEVPMDYADPDGATIELAVQRIAADSDGAIGSVVVNAGGPGVPGVGYAATLAAIWSESPIVNRFDIVGFDPRGVGLSTPAIDCWSDEEREDDAPLSAISGTGYAWTEDAAHDLVTGCATGTGSAHILPHLGTRDVARDLDILRAALGDERLTYTGTSYGTRLGAVYAEMFPDRVRALILDGAVDPLKGTAERQVQLFEGLQRSFEQMAAFCAAQDACPLGTDPAAATEEAQNLLRPLLDAPVITSDGRALTFPKATEGIIAALYSQNQWPTLIAALAELRGGGGDQLMAMRDAYLSRMPDGTYPNAVEATLPINCMDEERLTAAEATQLAAAVESAAPFMSTGRSSEVVYGCSAWPGEPTLGFPYATGIDGLAPTLVISVTGDGLTPHEGGVNLAKTLGARLLTVEGEQHGATLARNACIDKAVADYLIDLELPADGARCAL